MLILASEASKVLSHFPEKLGAALFGKRFACITTAASLYDSTPWVRDEQTALKSIGADIFEIELSALEPEEARSQLVESEGIYVHGGNTFFLLQEMQRIGFREFLGSYLSNGGLYIGSSAGTLVMGPSIGHNAEIDQAEEAPNVDASRGLGMINFLPIVHYDVESYWPSYERILRRGLHEGLNLFPLRDDQYFVVEGESFRLISAS